MGFTYRTPVTYNIATINAWVDVNVSADIPAGATGVILHINYTSGGNHPILFRKKGSTFDPANKPIWRNTMHAWLIVPVDANRIFQVWSDVTLFDLIVIGHTDDKVKFLDPPPLKSNTVTFTWQDIDITTDVGADAGNVLMAFGLFQSDAIVDGNNVRPNGSTDSRTGNSMAVSWFVKVDPSDIFEQYVINTADGAYLYGYAIADVDIPNLNAVERSAGFAINTWTDMAALPTGSVGGLYEIRDTVKDNDYGLRKNGSTESVLNDPSVERAYGLPECDAGLICEGYIAATSVHIFEWGGVKAPTGGGGGAPTAKLLATLGVGHG